MAEMEKETRDIQVKEQGVRRRVLISSALAGLIVFLAIVPEAWCQNWKGFANKSDAWYLSAEGLEVAENILSWQSLEGSWPKNGDTTASAYTGSRGSIDGTYDNGATYGEVRFLARAFNVVADNRYRTAVLLAIDDMLDAQYPTGGWPQNNPPGSGYARHITFNDNTMVNIMELMKEVAESQAFAFMDAGRRTNAAAAFDAGIECMLDSQIVVDGTLTAWCAQHDEVTLEPRPARSYEHASISGSESVGVVLMLIKYGDASDPRVANAIDSACEWYEAVKLLGIRQIVVDDNKVIISDPTAPPLWARFYEIGTNRPIFSDRDGIIKYDMAEIGDERRNGYSWYGDWPEDALDAWPAWIELNEVEEDEPVDTPVAGTAALGILATVCAVAGALNIGGKKPGLIRR
jgi:PelA/Pel-15E family pectate lyase